MNSIACGLIPDVSYFQTEQDNVITYVGRNLFLNIINRGVEIRLYRKKNIFYWPNYSTLFNLILFSSDTSTNFQPVKICQVTRNLSRCDISTSLGTFPTMLFQINISISNYIYVCCLQKYYFSNFMQLIVLHLCARNKISTPICFFETGLFPNRILDEFRISPNFE